MISRETAPHYEWGDHCESWHLLSRPDLTVVYERLPAGASERRHQHAKTRQFLYVLRGRALLLMDGQRQIVEAGQGAEILPGSHHRLGNETGGDLEFLVISHPHRRGQVGAAPTAGQAGDVDTAIRDGYLYAAFRGRHTPGGFVAHLKQVLDPCLAAGLKRVMVDITAAVHEPLTQLHRYEFASGVAEFWPRDVKIAIVGRPDQLDPERFGMLVARNRGLLASSHASEAEALQWLIAP
jgi:quercetin dioxygenase-like cupin family protein